MLPIEVVKEIASYTTIAVAIGYIIRLIIKDYGMMKDKIDKKAEQSSLDQVKTTLIETLVEKADWTELNRVKDDVKARVHDNLCREWRVLEKEARERVDRDLQQHKGGGDRDGSQ